MVKTTQILADPMHWETLLFILCPSWRLNVVCRFNDCLILDIPSYLEWKSTFIFEDVVRYFKRKVYII